jgi:stage II sporulation protein M
MFMRLREFVSSNSSWLVLSFGFFTAGFAVAFTALGNNPQVLELIFVQMEKLMQLGEDIYAAHPLQGIYLILVNNTVATFGIILFSFLIGLPSLFSLFGNGILLGAVTVLMAEQGISFPVFFFLGVMPHGIFELPAFFISASLGLKIGYHIVFPLPGETRGESLKIMVREVRRMAPVIFILLVAAACIEVVVTPAILQYFLHTGTPIF